MAGISSNALKGANYPENRKKYNGIEYTSELDLDMYDAQLRNLDPQIGRWNQIDQKIENMEAWSPYASNYDNPIRYNDFLGDEGEYPNKKGLINGIKAGFTGFFRNAGNAIANLKAMFSPQALLNNGLNVATIGAYGMAKGVVDNTRVVINEGANGAGEIVWEKAAELTVAVVVEAGVKAVNGLKGAGKSGLGDLGKTEVKSIQKVVDQAERPLGVVGSAASGTRRGVWYPLGYD
jgi:RHS repeat-associated protein